MIKYLPVYWQAFVWRCIYGEGIEAIRALRNSARIPIVDAKRIIRREDQK